jgi:hypothetical protein
MRDVDRAIFRLDGERHVILTGKLKQFRKLTGQ